MKQLSFKKALTHVSLGPWKDGADRAGNSAENQTQRSSFSDIRASRH